MEIKTVKEQVENVLSRYSRARSQDEYLFSVVHEEFYGVSRRAEYSWVLDQIMYGFIPSFESIRRCRQKIQESGKYPATEAVKNKRKKRTKVIREQLL